MRKNKINNRSFGILFFIIFLALGTYPFFKGNSMNFYLISLSVPFLILGLINSKILTPINKAWLKFGEILGTIIAPIIMAIVYFFILTPVSLIVRLFGKDLLNLNFNKKLKTYWLIRNKKLGSMDKQY
ncbi:SxtJ family membrane protein [Pelagibacteraceae bacterium]|nr:SxtJ family membrane protein [Pelagibacteraceae bacterium]